MESFAVFDDGSGPMLYASGDLRLPNGDLSSVARLESNGWRTVPGLSTSVVKIAYDLTVFDDGSGPKLYCLGEVEDASGQEINGLAVFDGTSWSNALDGELLTTVGSWRQLETYDDGTGPALYIGGSIGDYIDPITGNRRLRGISKVVGRDVQVVAPWPNFSNSESVDAMIVHDAGQGPRIYLSTRRGGSWFSGPGGSTVRTWDGAQWQSLGTPGGDLSRVSALRVFDDGSGASVYASGYFAPSGGTLIEHLARFDGTGWASVGGGVQGGPQPFVEALAVGDLGSGPMIHLGGYFESAGPVAARYLAQFDGASFEPLGAPSLTTSSWVTALAEFDSGGGPELYAGGMFGSAGTGPVGGIARWDGQAWSDLDGGMTVPTGRFLVIEDMVSFDDGSGPSLFAAGTFLSAGGLPVQSIARWDGLQWHDVGGGLEPPLPGFASLADPLVYDLQVFNDGTGPALYAAGQFGFAGGASITGIARWDGSSWSPLGTGAPINFFGLVDYVTSLAVFDDGVNGPSLYAAGPFLRMGGVPGTGRLARWDGNAWHPVGGGGVLGAADLIKVVDDGSGPTLLISGLAQLPGVPRQQLLIEWNGQSFLPRTGTAFPSEDVGYISAITTFDDGSGAGPRTVVAGSPPSAETAPWTLFYAWDGSDWQPISQGGPQGAIFEMLVHDDRTGLGPCLFAGGMFDRSTSGLDTFIARFGGCTPGAIGETYCTSDPNSTGAVAELSGFGSLIVSQNTFTLKADSLPQGSAGFFLASRTQGMSTPPLPSQGTVCIGGAIGRFIGPGQVQNSGTLGEFSLDVDLTQIPQPQATVSAMAGETWNFQAWYRDLNPGVTSNFTTALTTSLR